MKKWVCSVCGYVWEGETPPEACPVCKAPASKFSEKKEGEALAATHEFGVYAKTVKDNTKSKDQNIVTLDSLQSVTQKDVDGGVTYLGEMEKNLSVLRDALL